MDYYLLVDRPAARRRAARIPHRFGRGETRWDSSLPGFWPARRRWRLPLYLHLLRRHTRTPQPFSSLMFFERRTQSSIRHRRLRYLLLLSLRLALLLLLALAFANPFVNRTAANAASDKLLLLVIDNSFSMRAGSRLADAKRAAHLGAEFAEAPSDARAGRWRLARRCDVLTQPIAGRRPHCAPPLKASSPATRSASFGELARAIRSMARACRASPSSCISSATCRSPTCPRAFADAVLPGNVTLVLHPSGEEPRSRIGRSKA